MNNLVATLCVGMPFATLCVAAWIATMSRSRYRFDGNEAPYFLTCTVVGWLPVFARPQAAQVVLDSWRFLITESRLQLFGYVIMENHVHFIAAGAEISKQVAAFKSFTARTIIDALEFRDDWSILHALRSLKARHKSDRTYQLWQEGSHPAKIQDDEMMRQKLEYIHNNPVKRGYVERAEHWRYSSAGDYLGRPGLAPVLTQW